MIRWFCSSDDVHVIGHYHPTEELQTFVFGTMIKRVDQDVSIFSSTKKINPMDNSECTVIGGCLIPY